MAMADTKRGRERKGMTKQHQRRRYEIERELEAIEVEHSFEELYEELELELD